MSGRRVLVTGGTGFIGRHVVDELIAAGHEVISLSRGPAPLGWPIEHVMADVGLGLPQLPRCDAVAHLAGSADASASRADPAGFLRTNALGTLTVLEAARDWGARFVLASSQRVYRPSPRPLAEDAPQAPVDPYGYSKLTAEAWTEMYAALFALPAVVLRFFSVYGPGQLAGEASGVATIFVRRALAGLPLQADAGVLRDFTYVSDVARGVALALTAEAALGGTYNIATGLATPIAELARVVVAATGSASEIVLSGDAEPSGYVADISRARHELGYASQVTLERGIARYVDQIIRPRAGSHSAQGPSDG